MQREEKEGKTIEKGLVKGRKWWQKLKKKQTRGAWIRKVKMSK